MSGQGLANLAAASAAVTFLLLIVLVVYDRSARMRLELANETLIRRARARGVTLTRVRRVVEEGVEAVELEGPSTEWGRGYLTCADAVLQELDR